MLAHIEVHEETTPKIRFATHVGDGVIDGVQFSFGVTRKELEFRIGSRTVTIDYEELVKALVEATEADDEGWTPMQRTDEAFERHTGKRVSVEEGDEIWANNLYVVNVHRQEGLVHLSFHRRDRAPVRDWRHVQRIKNEVCGPEYEGLEVYPSESRLVDTSNQYHCWVLEDAQGSPVRIPFGFSERLVLTPEELAAQNAGATQRPFEEQA